MDISLLSGPPPDAQGGVKPGTAYAFVPKAGEIIKARVAQILAKGLMQLDLGGARLVVKSQLPLQLGEQLALQVEQGKEGVRLVIFENTTGNTAAKPEAQLLQNGTGKVMVGGRGRPVIGKAEVFLQTRSGTGPAQGAQRSSKMAQQIKSEPAENLARASAPSGAETRLVAKPGPRVLQAAVSKAIQSAITNQNSLNGVFAEARQMLQDPAGPLPEKIQNVLKNLLALRLSGQEKLSGPDIKQAFSRSGIFMESSLTGKSAGDQPAREDLKATLMRLRGALRSWLGEKARPLAPPETRFSPPFKRGLPQGQPPRPPVPGASLPEAGRILLGEARAAA